MTIGKEKKKEENVPKFIAYVYACKYCGHKGQNRNKQKAQREASRCEKLPRPHFQFALGSQVKAVREGDGKIPEDVRILTVVKRFYRRVVHERGKGMHRRKIAVHLPAYALKYTARSGKRRKAELCFESTLVRYAKGPLSRDQLLGPHIWHN